VPSPASFCSILLQKDAGLGTAQVLHPPGQNVSTACTLQLVHGKRHILADSWFASVETAVALKNVCVGQHQTCQESDTSVPEEVPARQDSMQDD
jgi:hypothetical protein